MKDKLNSILIVALLIFAFISGALWTKVRNLEKKLETEKKGEQTAQIQQQEPKAIILGAEEQKEISKNAPAVKGAEDAKVTIVEFSEYQCPFCKRYVDEAYQQIMKNYGDKIRYIFRDYPLPFHNHAQITAEAARCAGEQEKYWPYHDLLFDKQTEWSTLENSKETLIGYAAKLGLNQEQFRTCLESSKYAQTVKDDVALGKKMGVSGTPSFFINGKQLVGAQPFEVFKAVIEEELNK